MGVCKVCGAEVSHLIDGMCTYCLSEEGAREEKAAMDAENDISGSRDGENLPQSFAEAFKGTRIPMPDLGSPKYVASHAGCAVASKAWQVDGAKLMAAIKANYDRIVSGELDYGTTMRYLNCVKPGFDKKLVKRLGNFCLWEYIPEDR